jgi:DNA-binding NarL/FixJ family response regulator
MNSAEKDNIPNRPISIYFRKDGCEYIKNTSNDPLFNIIFDDSTWETKLCATWNELSDLLVLKPHQIIFHVETIGLNSVTVHEFISMIETLVKVTGNIKIPMAVSIETHTSLSIIKELQKNGLHGIVPSVTTFGSIETYKGIEALFNRIPYYPKYILDRLPGAKKFVIRNTINVTPRQAQILDLILERGLSNKKIAQVLNITESTVKIHVSAILKAYGVRTRTQLVVSSLK